MRAADPRGTVHRRPAAAPRPGTWRGGYHARERDAGPLPARREGPGHPGIVVPRGGGGELPATGDAHAAAERGCAAAAVRQPLTLPFLASDVPTRITLRLPETHAIALAEALLAEGVLQEDDWNGTVAGSIGAGITRWTRELLGGQDLARIPLGLFWTDDVAAVSGMDPELWCKVVPGRDPSQPVGLLGLVGEEWDGDRYPFERDVHVGATVLAVERVRPGLGWQLLYLLQEILPVLLCAGCLHWAYDQARKADHLRKAMGWLSADEVYEVTRRMAGRGLMAPQHGISAAGFLEAVPAEAVEGRYRPGVIREARRHALPEPAATLVRVANEVLELEGRLKRDARRCDSHVLCDTRSLQFVDMPGAAAKQTPFCVRWSADDPLPAVVDDYRHQTRAAATNLVWCQGWQSADAQSLRKTARHWRQVVTLALRACQLAELMHADPEETP